jgi:streptomycin 6-kinase
MIHRTLTAAALSCVSLLSLHGYAEGNPNDRIFSSQEMYANVARTMRDLFYPDENEHCVKQMIPQAQEMVGKQLISWLRGVDTTRGNVHQLAINAAITLLVRNGQNQLPNSISEIGRQEAGNELASDLQAEVNAKKGNIKGALADYVKANTVEKKLIDIHMQRMTIIRNLY